MISKTWSRKSIATLGGGCRFECLLNGGIGCARSEGVRRAFGFRTSHGEWPESDFRWHDFHGFNDQHRGSKQRFSEHQQSRSS